MDKLDGSERSCQEPDVKIGCRLGNYRLLRLVSAGRMGSIYFAERIDGGFCQQAAIKILSKNGAVHIPARTRFERERAILAKLSHPSIAAFFDGGEAPDGAPYFAMEWVDGQDIATYCRSRCHTVRDRVSLLIKVATALTHAHKNLVIHCDIKPSNVLVTDVGDVKLLDFGISRLSEESADLTPAFSEPMTLEYAAPEQFARDTIAVGTDIYQFGVLCYRVLGGTLPYEADLSDPLDWARAVKEQDPRLLEHALARGGEASWDIRVSRKTLYKQLRGELNSILRKAMNKVPDQRYYSMDAMTADLHAFLAGRPVSARKNGSAYLVMKWLRRRPYVSAVAALLLLGILIISLAAFWQARIAIAEAGRASREAQRAVETRDFLVSLFQVPDPGPGRGGSLSVSQILDRGAARIGNEFSDYPDQKATLQVLIGEVYLSIGDVVHAKPMIDDGVRNLQNLPRTSSLSLAHALRMLSNTEISGLGGNQGTSVQILKHAEALLGRARTISEFDELVKIRATRGYLESSLAEDGFGIEDLRAAKALALRTGSSSEAVVYVGAALGIALGRAGKLHESVRELRSTLALCRSAFGNYSVPSLGVQVALGVALARIGQYDDAKATIVAAVENDRQISGSRQTIRHADAMLDLANVDLLRGDLAAAQNDLDSALKDWPSGANSARKYGQAWVLRGRIGLSRGKYEDAVEAFDQALSWFGSSISSSHPDLVELNIYKAEALCREGRLGEALDLAEAALAAARSKFGAAHPLTMEALFGAALARGESGDVGGAREALGEIDARGAEAFEGEESPPFVALRERTMAEALRLQR